MILNNWRVIRKLRVDVIVRVVNSYSNVTGNQIYSFLFRTKTIILYIQCTISIVSTR